MIFEVVEQVEANAVWPFTGYSLLRFPDSVAATIAMDSLLEAFPNAEIYLASYGGYANALEIWQ